MQEYGSFRFYSLCVTVYYLWREVLGAHALYSYVAKNRNPILRAVSPVPQNLYVEYLIQIHIFLAMKYASFGHSAYCQSHNGRFSHLRVKYDKSPQKILSIFTPRQHKVWLNVLIWSIYLSLMKSTRWDLCNDMYFIWVYCFGSMLMTSCFVGATPTVGRKRITYMEPKWREF